jgi:hypothetical protein
MTARSESPAGMRMYRRVATTPRDFAPLQSLPHYHLRNAPAGGVIRHRYATSVGPPPQSARSRQSDDSYSYCRARRARHPELLATERPPASLKRPIAFRNIARSATARVLPAQRRVIVVRDGRESRQRRDVVPMPQLVRTVDPIRNLRHQRQGRSLSIHLHAINSRQPHKCAKIISISSSMQSSGNRVFQ